MNSVNMQQSTVSQYANNVHNQRKVRAINEGPSIQPVPSEPSFKDIYDQLSIEQQHYLKRDVNDAVDAQKQEAANKVHTAWEMDVARAQYNQQKSSMEAYMNSAGVGDDDDSSSGSITLSYLDYQQDSLSFKTDLLKMKQDRDEESIVESLMAQAKDQTKQMQAYQQQLYTTGEMINVNA
ncbi:hypothetical protein ACFSJY_06250 [Thalassotalea euphylliae]|uniref:hypothetical protein n=1 Tax=Thalassotalea euphylliae TaxID=1655234 RepID=UPI0036376127